MSSHFNFKSLTFYGVAIGSVLLLFNFVTRYGEANLKAPGRIDGRYRLSIAQSPSCLNSADPVLTIQQSGIYLNGFLLPSGIDTQTKRQEKPSLTGQLNNQQLNLAGTVPSSVLCNNLPRNNPSSSFSIQSQLEGKNLAGKMTLSGISEAIEFTAQPEAPIQPAEKSNSH